MRERVIAAGGGAAVVRSNGVDSGGPPSMGRPSASITRPSSSSPTGIRNGAPVAVTWLAGPIPSMPPSGIRRVRPSRKPTTSAGTSDLLRPAAIVQSSPTSARRPLASITRPMTFVTRPRSVGRSASRSAANWRSRTSSVISSGSGSGEALAQQLGRARELLLDAGVDVPLGGADDAAAATDPPLGNDLDAVDASEAGGDLVGVLADELEIVGVDLDDDAIAIGEPAQRPGHGLADERRIRGDRRADHLLGEGESEVDGAPLGALEVLVEGRVEPARCRLERGTRGCQLRGGQR